MRCGTCKRFAPITEMRYEKTGKFLVCNACRHEETTAKEPKLRPLVTSPFDGAKVLKYQCPSCRYTFRRTPTHPVNKCPNCNSSKLLRYEKVSADDVLKMTDDEKFSGL